MTSSRAGAPDEPFVPETAGRFRPAPVPPATAACRMPVGEPVQPEQSREDTDAAWGDYPEPADDRLYRDRPPHWDDF
jgi:hypothetical protein